MEYIKCVLCKNITEKKGCGERSHRYINKLMAYTKEKFLPVHDDHICIECWDEYVIFYDEEYDRFAELMKQKVNGMRVNE